MFLYKRMFNHGSFFICLLVVFVVIIFYSINNSKKEEEEKAAADAKLAQQKAKDEERERTQREAIEKIEVFFNGHDEFKNGKLFHGCHANAILVGRNGDIGIFNDSFTGCKIINIKDIKSIKSSTDSSVLQCVFSINDFDNPIVTVALEYYFDKDGKDEAVSLYNEIKATINALKKSASQVKKENESIIRPQNDLSIDFENDKIEIEYETTQRRIKLIGKEYARDDYYIKCFCYLRNEERTFKCSKIQRITINGLEYDIKNLIHLFPSIKLENIPAKRENIPVKMEYNIPVKMTYQNVEGEINCHEIIINRIRIAQNGVFYVDKLSLFDEPVSFCIERIKDLTIDGVVMSNPSECFKDLYFKDKKIAVYLNQVLVLLYAARIDNRFTQTENDIIKDFIKQFDNDAVDDDIIKLTCSDDEYTNIIVDNNKWNDNSKDVFLKYLTDIYNSKKSKNEKEKELYNDIVERLKAY